jgi:putative PIN family toxin of toxin-antitoxin system
MRVVFDTNVIVSGLLFEGVPGQLLDQAWASNIELCSSEVLLVELQDVLSRAKFAHRLGQADLTARDLVADLRRVATIVTASEVPRIVTTDPDDDHVLAAAVAANADLIATGDSHLLALGSYMEIAIVTARQVLERIADAKRK